MNDDLYQLIWVRPEPTRPVRLSAAPNPDDAPYIDFSVAGQSQPVISATGGLVLLAFALANAGWEHVSFAFTDGLGRPAPKGEAATLDLAFSEAFRTGGPLVVMARVGALALSGRGSDLRRTMLLSGFAARRFADVAELHCSLDREGRLVTNAVGEVLESFDALADFVAPGHTDV